jgi:hypothetical protein
MVCLLSRGGDDPIAAMIRVAIRVAAMILLN